jgi:uncharacterized delta-60 repeat protein
LLPVNFGVKLPYPQLSERRKSMLRSFFRSLALLFVFLFLHALPVLSQQADPQFGTNGFVRTVIQPPFPFSRTYSSAVKAFYLPDGTILTICRVRTTHAKSPPQNRLHLIQYSIDGLLVSTISIFDNFVPTDAVRQPDGKIVVAGYGFQSPNTEAVQDWKIMRFNANLMPDTEFGANGIVVRSFSYNDDVINNVQLQADGKIVVSGTSLNPPDGFTATVVARFNSNGSVDSAFGPYGEGFFDIYDGGAVSKKLIVQPDGKFLLAGNSPGLPPGGDVFFARYNASGTPDAGFGSGGYVSLNYNAQEILNDLKLQPDGKILVLLDSNSNVTGSSDLHEQTSVLARFTASGARDSVFGASGEVFINTSPPGPAGFIPFQVAGGESARSILVRANGNILISGLSSQVAMHSTTVRRRKYVVSVLEYGSRGEFINKNYSRRALFAQTVALAEPMIVAGSLEQPDGKILIYGDYQPVLGATQDIALARYLSVSAGNDANNFFDYNFDGKDEYAVYRPNASGLGTWFFLKSNPFTDYQFDSRDYGASGDILTPGDFDGDGVQDLAVFRSATGEWISGKVYLDNCAPMSCVETVQFGANGDIPAPGDFDGDGKTDRAVFRPSSGDWYILFSSGGFRGLHFGQNGDKPVVGDYDGDGKSDIAVIRRTNGQMFWYILQSSDNQFISLQFGITEDKTVAADYNGDAKTEIAVWRPSDGTWYVLTNYTNFSFAQFGANGDLPEAADYDGDRKADFAIFRPSTGTHYVLQTSTGNSIGTQFGAATDIPIASAYVR